MSRISPVLPLLCIFCQPEDLETLNLDEQWEVYAYANNSYHLPVHNKNKSFSQESFDYLKIIIHGNNKAYVNHQKRKRKKKQYIGIPHHKPCSTDASHPIPLLHQVYAKAYTSYLCNLERNFKLAKIITRFLW